MAVDSLPSEPRISEEASSRRLWLLPSPEVLVFCLVFLAALTFMPSMLNGDGDLGRHITIGNYILDEGVIPTRDLFSHTMDGERLVPHEWLSQSLFALSHRLFGLNGVAWLTALVLAATYAVFTAWLRKNGVRAFISLGAGLAAAMTGWLHTLTRPHIFTLLFFTAFLLVLESYRRSKDWKLLIPLPLLMMLWANMHGAFISGLVLVALYAVGSILERNRRELIVFLGLLLALWLASWMNPVGPPLAGHSFGYLQERFLVDVTIEYRSPNFHSVNTWPFLLLLLASLALGWRTRDRMRWTSLILLVSWAGLALYSARNIPLYGLAAVFILTWEVGPWLDEVWPALGRMLTRTDEASRRTWGWMWAGLLTLVLIGLQAGGFYLDAWRMGNRFDPQVFPVAAVDALEGSAPEGPVFNEFTWGGYLLYRLWPEKQVFIDGQTDFYGEGLTREYLAVIDASPGWEEILDRYGVEWIILPPDRTVSPWLDQSAEWERQYEDETAVVWIRS
jgi:hypothetical protein